MKNNTTTISRGKLVGAEVHACERAPEAPLAAWAAEGPRPSCRRGGCGPPRLALAASLCVMTFACLVVCVDLLSGGTRLLLITAVPNTKLCAWGEEESGGHVL